MIFNACSDVEISGVELSDFVKCKNMEQGGSAWYQEAMHFDYASEEQDYEEVPLRWIIPAVEMFTLTAVNLKICLLLSVRITITARFTAIT